MREHGLMYTCIFGCYYIGSLGFMYITSFKALIPFLQKKKKRVIFVQKENLALIH